jgi:hypothetical protein
MSLPEGLKWLQPGWWTVHTVAILVVFWYGYQRGRQSLHRDLQRKAREQARGKPSATPA